jgi:phage terminase small subunit
MGRKAKLAVIKHLEGNPGKKRIPAPGVSAKGGPFIPDHVSDDAHACMEIIRQSMPVEVYSRLDSFELTAFATAWAIHKYATIQINSPDFEWMETIAAGTKKPNPWLAVLNEQVRAMVMLGDRLGLDPKSRAALRTPAEQPKSKFADLTGTTVQNESSDSLNC